MPALTSLPKSPLRELERLAVWFADAIQHAIGSLSDQEAMAPPLIGVQPYRDRPSKLR